MFLAKAKIINIFNMASEAINKYIGERYERWLDYSKYHCEKAGMTDEAVDVLNEVLMMILQKDEELLKQLYQKQRKEYRELDYYILRTLKLNIQSPTSPYRWRYKRTLIDENADIRNLDMTEDEHVEEDTNKVDYIRKVFEQLSLTVFERDIFYHFFYLNETASTWRGKESKGKLYSTYKVIRNSIRKIIEVETNNVAYDDIINNCAGRERRIVTDYFSKNETERIIANMYLSNDAIDIFSFKFIKGCDYSKWDGVERKKKLNKTYDKVLSLYQDKINNRLLF